MGIFTFWRLPSLMIAGGLLATTPAFAQSAATNVAYGDLNLGSAEGRATLQRRITTAVSTVCGRAASPEMPAMAHEIRACRVQALRGAQIQLSAAMNDSQKLAARRAGVAIASR